MRFARRFLSRQMVHVNLQIIYECNFKCRICDFWKPQSGLKPMMTAPDAELLSNKLNEWGPQIVSIGGGEPTMHPDLLEITRVLARHHFPVMICNGSHITPEYARSLWEAGLVEISVSLDYATPEKHETQRGAAGSFNQAVNALALLHETRTHPEQRVNMISVIMDDNLEDVESLIRMSEAMGISYLVTLYSHQRGEKPLRASSRELSRRLMELKKRHRHFVALRGYLERFTEAVTSGGIGPCYAGKHLCNIDSQGDVSLCIDRLNDPVGNLIREDAQTIARRLREAHQNNSCRDCWTSCRGSIESLMYGRNRLANAWDYFQMTRPVSLGKNF